MYLFYTINIKKENFCYYPVLLYCIIKKTIMKKISIDEIHIPPIDIKAGLLKNTPKDRMILDWLIMWLNDGIKNNLFNIGDLIPSKKDLAKYHSVSTGTIQNAIRYAEDLGYFQSKQCVGTIIADKNAPKLDEKGISKKDEAVYKIKKYIIENKIKQGETLPAARIIANEIETSQNTVRLALDILIRENLIQNNQNQSRKEKILIVDYKNIEIKKNPIENETQAQTLSNRLYTKIKHYIVENYKINDKIMPNEDFAKLFNVSVRTVNDAMKRLNKEKIILSLRGQYGTRYINEPERLIKQREGGEKSKFMSSPKSKTLNIKNSYDYSWQRVLDQIKKYMMAHHEAGDKLPSMKNLAEILNVSSNTIRRAIYELVKQGILFCQRGKYGGIYIVEMPAKEDTYQWLALNPKFLVQ